jgi:hypothetical protein
MLAIDDKQLRESYQLHSDCSMSESRPAIQLVSMYLVEQRLILEAYEVERKSNATTVLPAIMQHLRLCSTVVRYFIVK